MGRTGRHHTNSIRGPSFLPPRLSEDWRGRNRCSQMIHERHGVEPNIAATVCCDPCASVSGGISRYLPAL
jgi:hypothetical protein